MTRIIPLLILLLLLSQLIQTNSFATNWCDTTHGDVGCFLMEDNGDESDKSQGNTLTETSGDIPQNEDKKFGTYSRDFDYDDSEYLTHADSLETDISGANANFTICCWVKPESLPSLQYAIAKYRADSTGRQFAFQTAGDEFQIVTSNSSADASSLDSHNTGTSNPLSIGTWTHGCAIYDDVNLFIYADGVQTGGQTSKTDGIYDGTAIFTIGARGDNTGNYDGLIDDVGIFNTDLDSTDINDIMDNGLYEYGVTDWCDDANVTACYTMDVDETTIQDISSNNRDALVKADGEPDYVTTCSDAKKTISTTGCFSFDKVDDYIDTQAAARDALVGDDGHAITYTAWAYPKSTGENGWGMLYNNYSESAADMRFSTSGTNTLHYYWQCSGDNLLVQSDNNVYALNEWSHFALSWDGSLTAANVQLYSDGVEVSYQTQTNGTGALNTIWHGGIWVGNRNNGGGDLTWDGYLDEVAFFDDIKDSTDINDIMDNGLAYTAPAAGRTRRFF